MSKSGTPLAIHIAPLHRRHDVRVFLKQCASLADAGFEVVLVVADGNGDAFERGVKIVDVGLPPPGKLAKRLVPLFSSARYAHQIRPDVIHFHDGMFLPFAIILALLRHRVFYDVHEDYSAQALGSTLPLFVRHALSLSYRLLEAGGQYFFKYIFAATPSIARKFPSHKTTTVHNFPLLAEFSEEFFVPHSNRERSFAYVGGISRLRGIDQMIDSMELMVNSDVTLELGGEFSPVDLINDAKSRLGWRKVNFNGWMSRSVAAKTLSKCQAGLVLFHPAPNHVEALPNKLFEYMAAGLPVIASDFPLWRDIIEKEQCGLLVDPLKPQTIADAMDWILNNPREAAIMGERGKRAVSETYNWEAEARKLLAYYNSTPESLA